MNRRRRWQDDFENAPMRDASFNTMSGVALDPVYGPDDGEFPGTMAVHAGPARVDVPVEALDDATVRGFRHRRGHQTNAFRQLLAAGGSGPVDRVRHADVARLPIRIIHSPG